MPLSQQSAVSWQGQEREPGFEAVAVGGQRWKAAGTAVAGPFAQGWQPSAELPGPRRPWCEESLPSGRKGAANRLCGSALLRAELLRCAPCCCCPRGAAQGRLCRWRGPGPTERRGHGRAAVPEPRGCRGTEPCWRLPRARSPRCPAGTNPALPHSSARAVPGAGASTALCQRAPEPCPAAEKEPLREGALRH